MSERTEIKVGDWVLCCHSDFVGTSYSLGQVTRVSDKLVYAKANYRSQHRREDVVIMPSEEVGRNLIARIESFKAEAQRRKRAAADWQSLETERAILEAVSDASAS